MTTSAASAPSAAALYDVEYDALLRSAIEHIAGRIPVIAGTGQSNTARTIEQTRRAGADVLGVSRDSARSHQNFCDKQGFGFELVSDPDETLCNAFEVIKEKQLYGRKYIGIERSTFLIDPESRVAQSWRGVKVPGHAQAVLDALTSHRKP